ncbi:hypothetical protein GWI33_022315 [Rhynchophorus ferrugineus]|uniref:Uncharacterized protein n=1 Tax=Rhynchophorus ferrugineus TaxID=354439 RepID=A0A834ISX0_RHYFE|nr:hypothetical protein GWI33_022315 [Rhynchophorus ferrugineus]
MAIPALLHGEYPVIDLKLFLHHVRIPITRSAITLYHSTCARAPSLTSSPIETRVRRRRSRLDPRISSTDAKTPDGRRSCPNHKHYTNRLHRVLTSRIEAIKLISAQVS